MRASLLTLALAAAIAAPVPKGKVKGPYYPVTEGAERVTEQKVGERVTETTEIVTKVEEKGGKWIVTARTFRGLGGLAIDSVYEVSNAGVGRLPPSDREGETIILFKPGKVGDTWEVERATPDQTTVKITYTLGKEEVVEVPAGKFKATPVVSDQRGVKTTSWYAPGVGLVKSTTTLGGSDRVTELKSFTPGKSEKAEPMKDE